MMMYSYERNGSFSDLSNASLAADVGPVNTTSADLVGRFSDLSMKSLSHFHNNSSSNVVRRRCSAKLSYDSDASLGSEMSLKSGNTLMRTNPRVHRRFSHTGSLSGHSFGRASPVGGGKGRAMRRMSEMSIGEYSNATESEEKGGLITPPQTIYTIREDESETNSIGGSPLEGLTKNYSQHSFTQAFPSLMKVEAPEMQASATPPLIRIDPQLSARSQTETKSKGLTDSRHTLKIPPPTIPSPSHNDGTFESSCHSGAFAHSANLPLFRRDFAFDTSRVDEKSEFGVHSSTTSRRRTGEPMWRRPVASVNVNSVSESGKSGRVGNESKSKAEKYLASLDMGDGGPGNETDPQETESIENAAAPYFIQSELVDYNGRGPYGPLEQLIILLYGYQFFYSKNVYSIVSRKMNYKRNRASVRQKLEQIVHKASGQQYGSLLNRRDEVLPILRREFWRILYDCEAGSSHDQAFAAQIKKLAHSINMPEQAA